MKIDSLCSDFSNYFTPLGHSCPGFHRDKLQQESVVRNIWIPVCTGMTQSKKEGAILNYRSPLLLDRKWFYKIPPNLPLSTGGELLTPFTKGG